MTQKELLYFEDSIGHEENVIKIINDNIKCLKDEKLKEFMNNEVVKHESIKKRLLDKLEEKANG